MRKLWFLFCLGAVLTVGFAADSAPAKPSPLIGTWELNSDDSKSMKFITPTHFVIVWMDPKTKEVRLSFGGRYKHEGDNYIEIIEFSSPEAKEMVAEMSGKELKFSAKVAGDKWTHRGELPGGIKIDEVWQRVK